MKNFPITAVTRALAGERNTSVFMLEIGKRGDQAFVESHATLRDEDFSRRDMVRAVILGLETALEHYKRQLGEMPERSGT